MSSEKSLSRCRCVRDRDRGHNIGPTQENMVTYFFRSGSGEPEGFKQVVTKRHGNFDPSELK